MGRRATGQLTYTGPAQIEDDGSAKVVEIRLSVPQRLPMDLAWQQMEDESCLTKEQILEMYMGDSDE